MSLARRAASLAALALLVPSAAPARVVPPPARAHFDYQLGGSYAPPAGVRVVFRDRSSSAVRGLYSVCYVNAYQTQAEEIGWWKRRHPSLLLRDAKGRLVGDPNWPGEVVLDTRTAAKRASLASIIGRWMRGCKAHGFRAVDPDNLDTWTRSHGLLTQSGNLALARLLVVRAHRLGLAIGQKNAVEISQLGRHRVGFDFAVAEECQVYHECAGYMNAYGGRVYEIEYPDDGGHANFAAACADHGARIGIIYRDLDLVPAGADGYVYETC